MPRRKNKNRKRQERQESSVDQGHGFVLETSLEEDLRQQRLRQKERKKKEPPQQTESPVNEEVEPSIPFETIPTRRQDVILRGMATTTVEDLARLPTLSFGFLPNESPLLSSRQRNRIQNIWHSKYLLENMLVNSRASMLYKKMKWRNHSLPDGMNATVDMTCKSYLHASSRTFDVATLDEGHLPTIATAVQGGLGIFGRRDQFHTLRGLPVYCVRMHEKSGRCGTIVMSNDRYSLYKFQCYPVPDATTYFDVMLQEPVTDFAFGSDLVLFACPRYFGRSTLSPIFLTLEDGRQGSLRSLNVQNFPQSDALRVEMTCDNEKYVAFGHRNGQVSLLDLRQSHTCCSILQYLGESSTSPLLGSATDLKFLSSNQQLAVKRSFGSTQLHDLRQISSSSANHHHLSKKNPSVVHNFEVPSNDILATASSTCNGIAVDPSCQQTLMTPYINTNHEACLGFWSLKSGVFVGSTVLAKNRDDDTIFAEVCSTTTASFSSHSKRKMDPSQFGVWLKCGRFSKQSLHLGKVGSLHHLSFPGSILSR